MKKRNKKLLALLTATVLTMGISTTAFAAAAKEPFSATLPKKCGDTEVSTVKRASSKNKNKYFTITLTSIENGYTSVCAWTEGTAGKNLSSPTTQVTVPGTTKVNYTSTPKKGKKVVLNLDNPVYTTNTPKVVGKWTPN